ncbi:hypothetical protein [Pseudomonas frederiksbergensis]|uniref:hypothetical protein n=1 Tax=Pseudomonas frederiksbergensis TaxID=104087 RepID=UPI0011CE8C1F|nr:hypothetical protein [Pseudomonas frederiksbergensis]
MTIDIQVLSVADISTSNNVLDVGQVDRGTLSAASFLVVGKLKVSLVDTLGFLFDLVSLKTQRYEIWLFLGNSAWQPDTRIVRYHKLWGALRLRGVEILGGSDSQELAVEGGGGVKFFGAVRLSKSSIVSAINAISDERCSYIVALPDEAEVKTILEVGWSGDIAKDVDFLYYICEKNSLIFKAVGAFDDFERGFVSVATPSVMRQFLS